jgi:hypothetical protein
LSISVRLRNLIRGGLDPIWAAAPYKKKKKKSVESQPVLMRDITYFLRTEEKAKQATNMK